MKGKSVIKSTLFMLERIHQYRYESKVNEVIDFEEI
jgi:hypothetical protein